MNILHEACHFVDDRIIAVFAAAGGERCCINERSAQRLGSALESAQRNRICGIPLAVSFTALICCAHAVTSSNTQECRSRREIRMQYFGMCGYQVRYRVIKLRFD